MIGNLMNFENNEVEVFEWKEKILFNPYHVGNCIGLVKSTVRDNLAIMNSKQVVRLKNSDVVNTDVRKLNNRGESFITESGVYKLIFKSRKPQAEKFANWVTSEVLPSIRKNGGYIHTTENDTDEVIMSRALLIAKKTIEERDKTIKEKNHKIEELSKEKEELNSKLGYSELKHDMNKHKVELAEILTGDKSINGKENIRNFFMPIDDFVQALYQKGYEIGKQRLIYWLKDNKLIYKYGYFRPTQKGRDLFHINRHCYISGGNEDDKIVGLTYKGFAYICERIVRDIKKVKYQNDAQRYYERQARKIYDSI